MHLRISACAPQIPVSAPVKTVLQNFFRAPAMLPPRALHLEAFLSKPQYVARRKAMSEKPAVFPSLSGRSARSKYKMTRLCAIISSGAANAVPSNAAGDKGFKKPAGGNRQNRRPICSRVSPSSSRLALSRPCPPARNLNPTTSSWRRNQFRSSPSTPASTSKPACAVQRSSLLTSGLPLAAGPADAFLTGFRQGGEQSC